MDLSTNLLLTTYTEASSRDVRFFMFFWVENHRVALPAKTIFVFIINDRDDAERASWITNVGTSIATPTLQV